MFTNTYKKTLIDHDEKIANHKTFISIDKEHNTIELYIKIHDYWDDYCTNNNISVYAVINKNGRYGTHLFNDKDSFSRYCNEQDEFYDVENIDFIEVGYRFK